MQRPRRIHASNLGTPCPLQQVGAPLGDHNGGGVGVASRHLRHYAGVHHAQSPDAMHPQLVINNGHRVVAGTHFAGARLVVLRSGVLSNGALPVGITAKRMRLTSLHHRLV